MSGFSPTDADFIRSIERQRLCALVNANAEVATQLHADDFQLINPRGESLSKEQYLAGIASGQIHYLAWEPVTPIEVRSYGEGAVIRYQSELEIEVRGERVPRQCYWHIDVYEKCAGRWQVLWSQATGIQK